MATISEDYVSFEIAKLLKEKGFDCPSYSHYRLSNGELFHFSTNCSTNLKQNDYVTAPTLQMAVKWLREVHNIHIDINTNWAFKDDFIVVGYMFNTHSIINSWYQDLVNYSTYEEACEAAIKCCLENLI